MSELTIDKKRNDHTNLDPISGAPGAHPVGTGIGAAAGGIAAGALAGTMAGPVGTLIGATVGAVVGGLAGKGVAEVIDPTLEEAYWRENYTNQAYVMPGDTFDDYGPAYRFGVDSYVRSDGRSFDQSESDLQSEWERSKGLSSLTWARAKHATRDSWERVKDNSQQSSPVDPSREG